MRSDVGGVGLADRAEGGFVLQRRGEPFVEVGDLIIGDRSHRVEGGDGVVDGGPGDLLHVAGHMEEIAGLLDNDEAVARPERPGELLGDDGHLVAAVGDLLTGGEAFEHGATVPGV